MPESLELLITDAALTCMATWYTIHVSSSWSPLSTLPSSQVSDTPPPKINPHICKRVHGDVQDLNEDLADVVVT